MRNKSFIQICILTILIIALTMYEVSEPFYPHYKKRWGRNWGNRWWNPPWYYRSDIPFAPRYFHRYCPYGCRYTGHTSNRPSGYKCMNYGQISDVRYCKYDYNCNAC